MVLYPIQPLGVVRGLAVHEHAPCLGGSPWVGQDRSGASWQSLGTPGKRSPSSGHVDGPKSMAVAQ